MSVLQSSSASLAETQVRVINSWSWGAAVFTSIYLLAMKSNKDALIALLLQFIPLVNLGVWIYYGVNAKKAAWTNRSWKGFEDFLACQRIWDAWAKWLLGIGIALFVLAYFLGALGQS